MLRVPRVLLLSNDPAESCALESVLREHAGLQSASNLPAFETLLDNGPYDAVFCGWSFHERHWIAVLEQVQQQCPDLPVVVFCGGGHHPELVQVLDTGAFDLLVAPYPREVVIPVLEHAVTSHEARHLHRDTANWLSQES